MKPCSIFISNDPAQIQRVYGPEAMARLAGISELSPKIWGLKDLQISGPADAEIAFSTWGMPALSPAELARMPKLKALFYAAGSVRGFAPPLLDRGISVVSAWAANAEPVAEFCLAQILLAGKNFLPAAAALKRRGAPAWAEPACRGNYRTSVALLGAGMVGRRLIALLKPFAFRVLVFDPFLDEAGASALGVEKVSLEAAFARGQVVSNHLADVPETRGLLTAELFESMPQGAAFLNTGRGGTVDEAGLWRILRARPDLSAVLDVTDPEPPAPGSPAYSLENVFLSPHLAGSLGTEVQRMSALMLDECEAWIAGKPLRYAVTPAMLTSMA
jgi:phosphoglycerate dehydrogenase-like enzyme